MSTQDDDKIRKAVLARIENSNISFIDALRKGGYTLDELGLLGDKLAELERKFSAKLRQILVVIDDISSDLGPRIKAESEHYATSSEDKGLDDSDDFSPKGKEEVGNDHNVAIKQGSENKNNHDEIGRNDNVQNLTIGQINDISVNDTGLDSQNELLFNENLNYHGDDLMNNACLLFESEINETCNPAVEQIDDSSADSHDPTIEQTSNDDSNIELALTIALECNENMNNNDESANGNDCNSTIGKTNIDKDVDLDSLKDMNLEELARDDNSQGQEISHDGEDKYNQTDRRFPEQNRRSKAQQAVEISTEQDSLSKGKEAETTYSVEDSDSSVEILPRVPTKKSPRLNHHKPSIDDDSTAENPTSPKTSMVLRNGTKPDYRRLNNPFLISRTLTHKLEDSSDDDSSADPDSEDSSVDENEQLKFHGDIKNADWWKNFDQLKKYKEKHGHCRVKLSEGPLGWWVANVRSRYKSYSLERYEKLREVGFLFRLAYSPEEDKQYSKQLIDFKKHNGCHLWKRFLDGKVRLDENPSKIDLCHWLDLQKERILRPNNNIRFLKPMNKDDKIKLILDVGILDTALPDDDWNEMLKKEIKFWNEHGRNQNGKEKPLQNWIDKQMHNPRKRIKEIRIQKLNLFNVNLSTGTMFHDEKSATVDNSPLKAKIHKQERDKGISGNVLAIRTTSQTKVEDEENLDTKSVKRKEDNDSGKIIATKKARVMRSHTCTDTTPPIAVSESQNCQHVLQFESEWNSRLEELKRYKQKHGHCNIRINEGKLGRWTHNQRSRIKPNQPEVRQHRLEKLKSIGFHFRLSYSLDQWKDRVDMLREFKKKHRHCNVDKEDYDFYDWFTLARERILFTHESKLKPILTPERVDELVLDLGILDTHNDDEWNYNLKKLVEFCRVHDRRPNSNNRGERLLSKWVDDQISNPNKCDITKKKLDLYHFDRLTGMAFHYDEESENEACSVQSSGSDSFSINPFDSNDTELVDEVIGFSNKEWNEHYRKLARFKKEHGHTRVHEENVNDDAFLFWFDKQKSIAENFRLEEEHSAVTLNRAEKLVLDLGILDDKQDDETWNQNLRLVIAHCIEKGAIPSRKTHYSLHKWLDNQKNKLYTDCTRKINREGRIKKLEMFGFDLSKKLAEAFRGRNNGEIEKHCKESIETIVDLSEESCENGIDANDMSISKEDAIAIWRNIPFRRDYETIWMCKKCWQRFENEEDAEHCMCIE